jgi:hypothetical protein
LENSSRWRSLVFHADSQRRRRRTGLVLHEDTEKSSLVHEDTKRGTVFVY